MAVHKFSKSGYTPSRLRCSRSLSDSLETCPSLPPNTGGRDSRRMGDRLLRHGGVIPPREYGSEQPLRIEANPVSVTTITRFHAAEGKEAALLDLQSEGRRRMLAAAGCESFYILHDQADPQSSAFIQTWSSREAHDDAFGELIMASGHLEKVLATLDEAVVQTFYDVVA